MKERFVIFTKPRVRDASGQIYAMAWDRMLDVITKGNGRTTKLAQADAIAKAERRANEAQKPLRALLSGKASA